MEEAITAAQQQKRRVRGRLADMRGEFGSTPVRGPWKPGRPGVKWHLYQAARRKHHALPYVQPVVGMRVMTYRKEPGTIIQVRRPMSRGGDPEVKIALDGRPPVYLFQTAVCGYKKEN